jgi:hypothetical protein
VQSHGKPIAINLWSQARRAQAYVSCLQTMTVPALEALDGGRRCPFLIDFGLTADQRRPLWLAVWNERTLVRTAVLRPTSDELLVRAIS